MSSIEIAPPAPPYSGEVVGVRDRNVIEEGEVFVRRATAYDQLRGLIGGVRDSGERLHGARDVGGAAGRRRTSSYESDCSEAGSLARSANGSARTTTGAVRSSRFSAEHELCRLPRPNEHVRLLERRIPNVAGTDDVGPAGTSAMKKAALATTKPPRDNATDVDAGVGQRLLRGAVTNLTVAVRSTVLGTESPGRHHGWIRDSGALHGTAARGISKPVLSDGADGCAAAWVASAHDSKTAAMHEDGDGTGVMSGSRLSVSLRLRDREVWRRGSRIRTR